MTATTRVLLVDDDDDFREMLRYCLAGESFEVETAVDGLDALRKLDGPAPNVVLLDLRMPRMNGLELIGAMKRQPALAAIPVIILTGDLGAAREALAAGAAGHLRKPFDLNEVVAAVLRHAAPASRTTV
jgi:CheY-like chemotaxis protein